MKKLFVVAWIILWSSIFVLSQNDSKRIEWETFTPMNEDFSVEFPVKYKYSKDTNLSARLSSHRYSSLANDTYFYIFSDFEKNPWQTGMVKKYVKLYSEAGIKNNIDGFKTEKFVFSDEENFHHTVLIIKSKNRAYAFQAISPVKDNPSVERFFNSIKLLEDKSPKSDDTNDVEDLIKIIPYTAPKKQTNKSVQSAKGNGNGRTNPVNPETKPLPAPTRNNDTAGIRILSKARANYTDFARFYGINGKVSLLVTFTENGTIGSVSPVSKLPFGLTEQSILAAREIKFEPARKDGKPFSVTKSVEYSFTIY